MSEKYVNINDRSEFVDALADLLTSCHAKHKSGCFAPDCRECIDRFFGISNGHLLPAADIAPVRHGRWKKSKGNERPTENGFVHDDRYVCDCCGWGCCCETKLDFSYCPNCGARMDGDADANSNDNKTLET